MSETKTLPDEDLARAARIPLPSSPIPEPSGSPKADEKGSSLWSVYLKHAQEYDTDMLSRWNGDMDILLIFAGLFSAVVTAFILNSLPNLLENYSQTSSQLLNILVLQSLGQTTNITLPQPVGADKLSIVVNCVWISSLILSLGSAFGAILCKQWLREYTVSLSPTPAIRMLQRHSRYMALERWHVPIYIAFLPVILHLSVMLFFAGVPVYLWSINETVAVVASTMIGIIVVGYVAFMLLPLFSTAPFMTPVTALFIQLLCRLFAYGCGFVYAAIFTVVTLRIAFHERAIVPPFTMIKSNTALLRSTYKRIMHAASLLLQEELSKEYQRGEDSQAEILSWLIHLPLDNEDMGQVVDSMLEIKAFSSQMVLADSGVEIVLLNHLQYSCFHRRDPDAPMVVIPEHLPFIISCLDVLSGVGYLTNTVASNSTWMRLPTEEIVDSLLEATGGQDKLRVLAASVFLVKDGNKSHVYRQILREHVMDHIEGVEELPDQIIKTLVDSLHPSSGFLSVSDMMRLLQKYLDQDTLPSAQCLHSILFNLFDRDPTSWNNTANRQFTSMHLIAQLLEHSDAERPLYLRLIRKMASMDNRQSIADKDLGKCLFRFLDPSLAFDDTLRHDVLETIAYAPECCQGHDKPLLRLTEVYQRQQNRLFSRAAIEAVAVFIDSICHNPKFDSDDDGDVTRQIKRAARVVAGKLIQLEAPFVDIEITLSAVYILSMASDHIDSPFTYIPTDNLLPKLRDLLRVPSTQREIAVIQHTLCAIEGMVLADMSRASVFAQSVHIWTQLAVDDDPRIRWLSFKILMFVTYYMLRDDRIRVFQVVKEDIKARFERETMNPFVDPNWRILMDSSKLISFDSVTVPEMVLVVEVGEDIRETGIRELLEGAPKAMICEKSVLVKKDFPWLTPLPTWLSSNR